MFAGIFWNERIKREKEDQHKWIESNVIGKHMYAARFASFTISVNKHACIIYDYNYYNGQLFPIVDMRPMNDH